MHVVVMPLVSSDFHPLAAPPSLQSCTRDVYADGQKFARSVLLNLAHGIAAAVVHLHARGILHGDLYAHNILYNAAGDALLGDFGAASFMAHDAHALQQLEVRAFGCLLEELLQRCDATTLENVWQLQRRCVAENVALRPVFAEIAQTLAALKNEVNDE